MTHLYQKLTHFLSFSRGNYPTVINNSRQYEHSSILKSIYPILKVSLQEIQRLTATSRPNTPNLKPLASITKSSRYFKITYKVQ